MSRTCSGCVVTSTASTARSMRASSAPTSPRSAAISGAARVRTADTAASGLPGRPSTWRPSGSVASSIGVPGRTATPSTTQCAPSRLRAACRWSAGPDAVEPGGHDEVGVGVVERVEQRLEGVGHAHRREGPAAEPGDPAGDHRAEGVADPTVARGTALEQLVAEHEDRDVGRSHDGQRVVARGGRHAGDDRRDDTAGLEQVLPGRALGAARTDVGAGLDVAGVRCGETAARVADPELATVHAVALEQAVLAAQHGVGTCGQRRAGGDGDRGAVDEVLEQLTGQQLADHGPGARSRRPPSRPWPRRRTPAAGWSPRAGPPAPPRRRPRAAPATTGSGPAASRAARRALAQGVRSLTGRSSSRHPTPPPRPAARFRVNVPRRAIEARQTPSTHASFRPLSVLGASGARLWRVGAPSLRKG